MQCLKRSSQTKPVIAGAQDGGDWWHGDRHGNTVGEGEQLTQPKKGTRIAVPFVEHDRLLLWIVAGRVHPVTMRIGPLRRNHSQWTL
jgi:hypothetical protein